MRSGETSRGSNPGTVLELGCGTGRLALPLLKSGADLVGIDRSEAMLSRARAEGAPGRARRRGALRPRRHPPPAVPHAPRVRPGDGAVRDAAVADLGARSRGDARRASRACSGATASSASIWCPTCRGGPNTSARVTLSGSRDARTHLTLRETVRQDTRRRLTMFDQEYVERRGGDKRVHRFALTFRTLSVPQMRRRLEKAGLPRRRRPRRLPGRAVAPRRRRLDSLTHELRRGLIGAAPEAQTAWLRLRGRANILSRFPRSFLEFSPCPATPNGTRSSTRRARPTPSAARSSRASSRN